MVKNYKCPGCGASLVYEEGSEFLACPYCETRVALKDLQEEAAGAGEEETDGAGEEETSEAETQDAETSQFQCSSCGGELVTDAYTAATICPFCGSPSILKTRLSGKYKPDLLIPFSIGKEEAKKQFRDWTKSGFFTPKGFYSQNTLESINGIYVPYWLYDFDASVHMEASATRVRTQRKGSYEYTYTDHFRLRRDTETSFDRIPVDASKQMPDDTMERLEPFSYEKLEAFEMPYLSGYMAERTNFESSQLEPRARERAKSYAERATRDTMQGYATVNVTSCNTRLGKRKQEYAMLPVWVLSYRYKNKNWQLYLNGQTGRRIGSLPVDPGRAAACFGICSAVVTVLAGLIWGIVL